MTNLTVIDCELCNAVGGQLLWRDDFARVVLIDDSDYPGFCRVILNQHAKEMTDLSDGERSRLMGLVFAVERVVRELAAPDKVNLASFGNAVPHLHWHVIPRWTNDKNFPHPIWANAMRESVARKAPNSDAYARRLQELLTTD
ncbi:MAG: HIT family protein [Burkholderiales bacterium]